MTVIQTIERNRDDTLTPEEITVIDEDSGDPKNISGMTFILSVTETEEPTTAVYLFQITGVITDAANGVVNFPLTDSDADNVGNYYYDIQLTSGGKNDTVMKGEFIMIQDRTKD